MKQQIKHHAITVVAVLAVLAAGAGAFVYSGVYNIGADDHHTKPVFSVLQMLREKSIEVRSRDIVVPDLSDPELILKGAGQYAAMCTGCHLKPGMADSEIRPGLYPQPPNLSQLRVEPREAFWVIKHGIKMSGMPAWGFNHDDPTIWSMVAFLQKLPDMTAEQYEDIVARAPADHDMEGGHSHSHGDTSAAGDHGHDAADDGHDHEHANSAPKVGEPISFEGLQPKAVPAAESVARAFQSALHRGDRAAVLALLAPDVSISEGGHVETRDEYASGHLDGDIAFLKNAQLAPVSIASMPMGDSAMVGSESRIRTSVKGKSLALRSREMLKLRQDGGEWKIVSVQWESTTEAAE
jgi:mono/diheme cytochrome c family protein/ketosteroid isomerase-like protein